MNDEFKRLMKIIKKIDYGRLEIVVRDGKPVLAEQMVKQIKLDSEDKFDDELLDQKKKD